VLDGADLQDARVDGADLGSASLQGVAASGASLTGADLTLAHLRDGDFRSANLTGAALTDADLAHANFERAILTDANLIGAELGGASFRDANLCGANLREAHVDGADFTGARFAFTVLAASDVSRARGLEAVVHDGPSTVGIDAFLLSRGELPDAFLTGIGLSPLTIEYLKAVAAAEEGMLVGDAIFLLFADADRTRARRLRAYLRMHRHQSWYWQETRILAGTHNPDLKLRIRFHDRLLVLGSEALSRDPHAGAPIREALAKEATEHRSIVLVARLDDSAPEGWPAGLGERVGADFRGVAWDDPQDAVFRRELERLLTALERR